MSTAATGDQATPQRGDRSTFVGRARELAALNAALTQTTTGNGRVVMLVGEAGIGKTRTAAEFVMQARAAGALVLRGGCYEGEWAPPYGPLVEALNTYVRTAKLTDLQRDVGIAPAPLARLIPALRERLDDVGEPTPLAPDEERIRLCDAVTQFLIATSVRQPVVLVLDDLHWADRGTLMLLRHVGRFAPQHRLLLLGAFRDVEIDASHPLANTLGAMRRESSLQRVLLSGLSDVETAELITALAGPVRSDVIAGITTHAEGSPFFVREVVQHLREQDALNLTDMTFPDLALPDAVRHVIQERIKRLSDHCRRLLFVASAFAGPFHLAITAVVLDMSEETALSAVDECLRVRVIEPTMHGDRYDFSHALFHRALYAESNPSRRIRLHRQLAEAMEAAFDDDTARHAGEIADQYYRSRDLPGAAKGAAFALAAADHAFEAHAHAEAAARLQMALDLLHSGDSRRPRIVARLAQAYIAAAEPQSALPIAEEAFARIAAAEGNAAAVEFAGTCALEMSRAGFVLGGWRLAARALPHLSEHRDRAWFLIKMHEVLEREATAPVTLGIFIDTPERQTLSALADQLLIDEGERTFVANYGFAVPRRRADAHRFRDPDRFVYHSGEFRRSLPRWEARALECEKQGRIANAVGDWALIARCQNALGNFETARTAFRRARELASRLTASAVAVVGIRSARIENTLARDEGMERIAEGLGTIVQTASAEDRWRLAAVRAVALLAAARLRQVDTMCTLLEPLVPVLELAPGWAFGFTMIACEVATAIWWLNRADHVALIERSLRHKVVEPDLRYPMHDGRLALAYTCALQNRHDEAAHWFSAARSVLAEQGARPLRAIVDYDEALMYARRDADGDRERTVPLLAAALTQFRAIGMPGWIRRAEHLLTTGKEWSAVVDDAAGAEQPPPGPLLGKEGESETRHPTPATCLIRCEGDVWSIAFAGATHRLKDTRGLQYLAHLFAHPRREFHVNELAVLQTAPAESSRRASAEQTTVADLGDAGEILDGAAASDYRRRLAELRDDLAEAEANNDIGRGTRVRDEMELLLAALASAGRGKRAASHVERARSAVGKRIRDALKQIDGVDPTLARYLRATVRTGTFCSYTPDPRLRIECERRT